MQNLNILIMPIGTITSLVVSDDFYYRLNPAYFDLVPVKSSDIRVQNLPTRDDMLEMPIAAFDSLRETAGLYEKMSYNLAQYAEMSSQGVVDFLTREILSPHFGEQMPAVFAKFPALATAYQQKFISASFNTGLDKNRQVFLLRPKFVLSMLQAYFEQNFVITQAMISQEKFANASFFDGSSEFRVNVTAADVLMPIHVPNHMKNDEQSYNFMPITFDIAGIYQPNTGYSFDLHSLKLLNDTGFPLDKQLQGNKQRYLTKIVNQSQTVENSRDFLAVLTQVGERFRAAEVQRIDKKFQ